MRFRVILLIIFFFCAVKPAAAAEVLDLQTALDLAVKNDSRLLSAEQNLTIAQYRVKEAIFRFFPQISFAGTITKSDLKYPVIFTEAFANHYLAPSSYENFYTFRTQVVQTLYKGGFNKNTLRMAKAGLKQANTEYEKIKREVELHLKKAFYEFLYFKELHKATQKWYDKIFALLKKSRSNIETDNLKQDITFDLDFAEKEITQKKLCLLKALNKDLDSEIDIKGNFKPDMLDVELEKAIFWAMELRPEVKSQVYKAEMDAISLNLAMSRTSPTVLLGGVYDFVGNKFPLDRNSWYTSLAIQFPLSFDLWTQVKQRRAEVRRGDLKRAGIQDEIKLEVRSSYNDLMFWQKQVNRNFNFFNTLSGYYKNTAAKQSASNAAKSAMVVYKSELKYLDAVKNQLIERSQIEWVLGCKVPCR
jgi:outer membrane protein TolC